MRSTACASYPAPVVIDHRARVGFEGGIRQSDVNTLCSLARHRGVCASSRSRLGKSAAVPPICQC